MPWALYVLNFGEEGSEEVQIMREVGGITLRSRMAWRTALPMLPVVAVRASIFLDVIFFGFCVRDGSLKMLSIFIYSREL